MKKINIIALACVAGLIAFVSCNKENTVPEQQAPSEGEPITISATIPTDGLTKVDLAEKDGYTGGLKLAWQAGDVITVTDASNPSNTQNFTLSDGAGTATGTFTGTALAAASSYNITYDALGADFNYAEQTQAADGSTAHLKYAATLSGVSSYDAFTFSEAWAASKGGTYASSGVLRLRADVPFEISDIKAVYIKADAPVFAGGKEIKVNITAPGDAGETDIITVYANLPAGDQAIAEATGFVFQFQVSDKAYDKYTAYRQLGPITLKGGKVNSIAIDCNTDQDITKYANKGADNIGTESNPYLVGDQHQMAAMKDEVIAGETVYFKVIDDIDLSGIEWVPLNFDGSYNKGVNFDGGKHTISNLTATNSSQAYPSFFGVLYGTAKDVTFEAPIIVSTGSNAGVIGGYIGTVVSDVNLNGICSGITVNNATVSVSVAGSAKGRALGAFAGQVGSAGSSITDCHVTGTTTVTNTTATPAPSSSPNSNVGGFIGFTDKAISITDCSVSGVVAVKMSTERAACSAGGFIGNLGGAATISGCSAAANVENSSSYYTGGFIGQIGTAVAATVSKCAYLGGNITAGRNAATNNPVAGFVGRATTNAGASFVKCYVDGAKITATKSGRVGGFCGDGGTGATANTFTSCYVKNTTISGAQHVGGFSGTLYGVAEKCYVESTTITANNQNVGGFAGFLENGSASNCYTSATVEGGSYANIGGFVGQCKKGSNVPGKIEYCYANGTVSGTAETVGSFIGVVTAVPSSVTKNIAWNGTLPFVGSAGEFDITSAITGNYCGTEGSISAQATTLGWDGTIWNLSGSVPSLK